MQHRHGKETKVGITFDLRVIPVCAEDVKRLNEKLAETSRVKMELQLKLDHVQSSEASVQVGVAFQSSDFKRQCVW